MYETLYVNELIAQAESQDENIAVLQKKINQWCHDLTKYCCTKRKTTFWNSPSITAPAKICCQIQTGYMKLIYYLK